jgi:hypothetical protein
MATKRLTDKELAKLISSADKKGKKSSEVSGEYYKSMISFYAREYFKFIKKELGSNLQIVNRGDEYIIRALAANKKVIGTTTISYLSTFSTISINGSTSGCFTSNDFSKGLEHDFKQKYPELDEFNVTKLAWKLK